ncbi:MAG: methionine--tRNA ligase [Candidatus Paceibacterota bacterium]
MKPVIEYSDFEKLDLRIGKVVAAVAPEWSEKLLQLTVDFGPEIGERNILAGIKQWYEPSQMVGKHYPFVINLAERKMGEGVSQGMMIMADGEPQPVPFTVSEEVAPGTIVR